MKSINKINNLFNSITNLVIFKLALLLILTLFTLVLFYLLSIAIVHLSSLPIRIIYFPFLISISIYSFSKIPIFLNRKYRLLWWHYPILIFSTLMLALIFSIVSGFIYLGNISTSSYFSSLIFLLGGFMIGIFPGSIIILTCYDYLMNKNSNNISHYNFIFSLAFIFILIVITFSLLGKIKKYSF